MEYLARALKRQAPGELRVSEGQIVVFLYGQSTQLGVDTQDLVSRKRLEDPTLLGLTPLLLPVSRTLLSEQNCYC